MHNLRDEKGFLKATIPDDVVWSIIHKRIVEHFAGPGNKVCLRITQDTEMSCRAGPYSSKLGLYLWAGDYLEPV